MNNNLFDRITQSATALIIFPPIFCIVPGFILLNSYTNDPSSIFFWAVFGAILSIGILIDKKYKKITAQNDTQKIHNYRTILVVGYLALTAWLAAISVGGAVLAYAIGLITLACAVLFCLARPKLKA